MVKLYLDTQEFKNKPNGYQIAKITNRLKSGLVANLTIQELATEISKGKTTVLATTKNHLLSKADIFEQQQIFMLDFDNKQISGYSIMDAYNDDFIKNNACFIYKTFSHDDKKFDRFRVVFMLDKPIKNAEESSKIYKVLLNRYRDADPACKNPNRLFFGSKEPVITLDFNNRLSKSGILTTYELTQTDIKKNIQKYNQEIKDKFMESDYVRQDLDEQDKVYNLLAKGDFFNARLKIADKFRDNPLLNATFNNTTSAYIYLRGLDLSNFLDLPKSKTFLDIFHEEKTPSANVFETRNHVYLYKCFSEKQELCLDIFKVVNRITKKYFADLGQERSSLDTLELILSLFGARIEYSAEEFDIVRNVEMFLAELNNKTLMFTHPNAYQLLYKDRLIISEIMRTLSDFVYLDENMELRYLSYMSLRELATEISSKTGKVVSLKKVNNIINLLVLSNTLNKLNDSQIPSTMLDKLNQNQILNKYKNRSSVYEILIEDPEKAMQIADTTLLTLANATSFELDLLSYDYLKLAFDEDTAKRVFPQAENKHRVDKKEEDFLSVCTDFILDNLTKKGYCYTADLVAHLENSGQKNLRVKMGKANITLDKLYNIKKTKLTRDLKAQLNITDLDDKANPFIYFFKKDA